ncbi:hypothetical protein [Pontibacter akesuensis]|uniref:Uncharacterized protein n=1 Tax=Pontibacter akesuensis TaxID=388950 RepID=A0A1I7IAW4_9BACT|nr:hypothetical protein [Pontibacter akesuensis]GHA66081.1 hypothetical protein GCM10007389_18880 [Pontibacter akesuensis]SFU69996.1 hypothetical protein SAMN04487941_2055 [Pontibacter akesuensis]
MKNLLAAAVLAGVLALQGCTVPQMAVEPGFKSQAQELPVEGRKTFKPNGNFSIGDFTVANVHRGWKRSGGFAILGYENLKSQQQYEFSLQNGQGQEWYVFGASRLHEKNLTSNNGISIRLSPNLEYYTSHFTSPESGQWTLLTADPGHYTDRKRFDGELTNGRTRYTVSPVYKFEGKGLPLPDLAGYEFKAGEEVLGAVQVLNNGKVWLKTNLPEDTRMVLTSAMASLLLYEKLQDSNTTLAIE